MTLWTGPLLPLAALIWPLLLAAATALPGLRERGVRLLPVAPLPALWLALAGGGAETTAPDLLLGVTLGLSEGGRLFLGMSAALWCLAGVAARPMAGRPASAIFAGFWMLTLAGNLGVFLARDIVTFYVAFAAVSLASWFLIVHSRTPRAMKAGTVYIIIALAGEVALLVGLILGAHAAGSMAIADVRAALGVPGLALLVIAFGIKAGLVPLHVWLPLAHPAAPVPASAVLSGAIVKAGLFGLLLFLPEGAFGPLLLGLGLAGVFGAALWGLSQANAKVVLAYSTISQMGLMIALIGAGGGARAVVPYAAMHHGFAKGALFLCVGVMLAARTLGQRLACLAVACIVAASVAGFPLTGGALAKAAAKNGLSEPMATVLGLSSVATTLILVRFLALLWRLEDDSEARFWTPRWMVAALAGGLAIAAPWVLWPDWGGTAAASLLGPGPLSDALWPVALALPLALALVRWPPPPPRPWEGLPLDRSLHRRPLPVPAPAAPDTGDTAPIRAGLRAAAMRLEEAVIRWRLSGLLIAAIILLMLALLV